MIRSSSWLRSSCRQSRSIHRPLPSLYSRTDSRSTPLKFPNAPAGVKRLPSHLLGESDKANREEYVQFLHFRHEENGAWWVYDQQPLGARLPTRLWYEGLVDSTLWEIPLPVDLALGRYSVVTGLYRTRDLERLPVSASADGTPFLDARVPLDMLTIESS